MQTITTKLLSRSETKPDRVVAISERHHHEISRWNDEDASLTDTHIRAARELRDKLGWTGKMYGGCLPNHDVVWVFPDDKLTIE
jgi:hypothetical protein